MSKRLLAIIAFTLCLGAMMNAQEKNNGEKTLFEVSFNNYGPQVRLFTRYGQLMMSQHSSGLSTPQNIYSINKKGEEFERILHVNVCAYDVEVGDSVITKIYQRLKQDVKRKKKEDKRWARQLKKNQKGKDEVVVHNNGATRLSVDINIKGVRYQGSITHGEKDTQYAKWFWDDMLDIASDIAETRGKLPQDTIDKLSDNGKMPLVYEYQRKPFLFPKFWLE
jgi:hypothetical protein